MCFFLFREFCSLANVTSSDFFEMYSDYEIIDFYSLFLQKKNSLRQKTHRVKPSLVVFFVILF